MEIKTLKVKVNLIDYIETKRDYKLINLEVYCNQESGRIVQVLEDSQVVIKLLNSNKAEYKIYKLSTLSVFVNVCFYDDIKDNLKHCKNQELPFIRKEDNYDYLVNSEDD